MNGEAPKDLTTLGAVGELPPKHHAIYDYPDLESFRAPTQGELPFLFMQLQQKQHELQIQIVQMRNEFTQKLQQLNQRLQLMGNKDAGK